MSFPTMLALAPVNTLANTSARTDGPTGPRQPFSTAPFADADFVDRPEESAWMREKLAQPGAWAVLIGPNGAGKSHLAIQYARDVSQADPPPFVFWVQATNRGRFDEGYRAIAERLNLPGRDDPEVNVLRLVHSWLCDETNGRWVMVLDGVNCVDTFFPTPNSPDDAPPSLAVYLPQNCIGSVLITSRNKDAVSRLAGGDSNIKEVLAMETRQATRLLRGKLYSMWAEEHEAAELVHALDRMPLAITLAAAYIHRQNNRRAPMTIAAYLQEFHASNTKRESLLNRDNSLRRDEGVPNSVVTAWQMSFERAWDERPSAAGLLLLMSFFNHQEIPDGVLRRYVGDDNDGRFNQDLRLLSTYSLVTITKRGWWEMQELVQLCTRRWLLSCDDVDWWERHFVAALAREFPRPDLENRRSRQQLLPHVYSLSKIRPSIRYVKEVWVLVLNNAAWYMHEVQGNFDEAAVFHRRALEVSEMDLGERHPQTLSSVTHLGEVLWTQGKLEEAEALNWRALDRSEKELGARHPHTLMHANNLAQVLQTQRNYRVAELLHRQVLEAREEELGEVHPDTLMSVSNLADVLQLRGKYGEAETLHRRALEGYEKELGEQNRHTLVSVSSLADVLQAQGKYDEAEPLHRRALEGKERVLGRLHRYTLVSVTNLVVVLRLQRKFDEAVALSRRALEEYERELGEHHPATLTGVNDLAGVLRTQRRYDEAELLNRRALEGRERVLGMLHQDTLSSVNNLAMVLHHQRKHDEAETLVRRALEGRETALGMLHPETLISVFCLAFLLHKRRRYHEAVGFYQRASRDLVQELGPEHQTTIACHEKFLALRQELAQHTLLALSQTSSET